MIRERWFGFRHTSVQEEQEIKDTIGSESLSVVKGLRGALAVNANFFNARALNAAEAKLPEAWHAAGDHYDGAVVANLSREFEVSPGTILRKGLCQGLSKNDLKKVLRHVQRLDKKGKLSTGQWRRALETYPGIEFQRWSARVFREVVWAVQNDREMDQATAKASAAHFEAAVVQAARDCVRPCGGAVLTERELRGNATPDVLFEGPGVDVCGHTVHWLDAKAMFAGGVSIPLRKKTREQAERYNKRFGLGALVFRDGFSQKLSKQMEDSVVLLDWSRAFPSYEAPPRRERTFDAAAPAEVLGVVARKSPLSQRNMVGL